MPADHNSGPLGLTTVYDRHERLLEAFEAAWQRGEQPAIEKRDGEPTDGESPSGVKDV